MNNREEILRLFLGKGDFFLSGEDISHHLGISRSAVWKQIAQLREMGYQIEAVPSRGYRLQARPDILIPAEIQSGLECHTIGRKFLYFDEIGSTNTKAAEAGESGAPEGTVVIADCQSLGKGRLGRQWVSPPGVNLYTSVLLRPPVLPRRATQLTFLSAVAVARSIIEACGLDARVKWPNDVLVDGKKIAGLLNEMNAETESIHYVVLGIGVNLNMPREAFPADLRYPATSVLLETGKEVQRAHFARTLYQNLDRFYRQYLLEGFAPILSAWEELFDLRGKEVEVDFRERKVQGWVEGLDAEGALLLRCENGELERVLAGDVRPLSR